MAHGDWLDPAPIAADFWRSSGGALLPDSVNDTVEPIAHQGMVALGRAAPATPAADLHTGGSAIFALAAAPNFPASGAIGTAVATVNQFAGIRINQTTPGISLTIPAPTDVTVGRVYRVVNVGTAHFVISGRLIAPATFADFVWSGAAWVGDGERMRLSALLAANVANNTAVMSPIAGLTVAIPTAGWWKVKLLAYYNVNAVTTGIGFNFQGGTATITDFGMTGVLASTATTPFHAFYQSRAQNWATAQSSRINGNLAEMTALMQVTAPGTFIPHFRSELVGALVTLLAGTSLDVERAG